MIIENNVKLIVSTCSTFENGREKCCQYWPNPAKLDGEERLGIFRKIRPDLGEILEFKITQDPNDEQSIHVKCIKETEILDQLIEREL